MLVIQFSARVDMAPHPFPWLLWALLVRLCMELEQTWSLEFIWFCCRSRRDRTVLQNRRNEDASDHRAGPRHSWWFSLDASTAAEGVGSEIREKQLWAGARGEELQHLEDQCGKRNYETHRCWLHNWALSKGLESLPWWIRSPPGFYFLIPHRVAPLPLQRL